ncbi:MAG TPA: hypothetical protein VHW43_05450, partial [Puia sp.]|nr:hypothetical protein [Puia sp.]
QNPGQIHKQFNIITLTASQNLRLSAFETVPVHLTNCTSRIPSVILSVFLQVCIFLGICGGLAILGSLWYFRARLKGK